MRVPKNDLHLPDPAKDAYEVLANFDRILEADPPIIPDYVPTWYEGHGYFLDKKLILMESTHKIEDEDLRLVGRFDGGTKSTLWLPSGILQYGEGDFFSPEMSGRAYLIGRRVSRGEPRVAEVLPAIFHVQRRVGLHLEEVDPESEDITHKADKLNMLNGWLKRIVNLAENPYQSSDLPLE